MSEAQKWYVNLYGSNQGKVYVGPLGHVVGVAEVNTICGMDQALKDAQLIVDAVNDLQTLRDERDRLREALQPFAERWEYFERTKHPSGGEWPEDLEYADDEPSAIYLGQLKAAKAALTPAGGGQE